MFVVACSSEGYSFVVICLIYQLAVCQPALILGMFSLFDRFLFRFLFGCCEMGENVKYGQEMQADDFLFICLVFF